MKINNIYNLDCLHGMREIDEESVDLIVTDPPFAIDFQACRGNYNHESNNVLKGYQDISSDNYAEFTDN